MNTAEIEGLLANQSISHFDDMIVFETEMNFDFCSALLNLPSPLGRASDKASLPIKSVIIQARLDRRD